MATTTIGPGQTYTTLAAWAAYVNALSLSADEIGRVVGTCSDTARVTVNGWTANGFSVILEASPGTGVNDGGRLWWLSSGRAVLSNSVSYDTAYFFTGTNLIVRNLQIRTTASNSNCVIKQGGGSSIVERCVIQNAGNSYAHDFVSSGGVVRLSLIISGPNSGGVRDGGSGGSGWVRRCTIVSGGGTSTGLQSSYGTLGAQGSAVYGFSTIASGTALSGSGYNAISGTTWGGSGWSGSGQTGLTAADFASTGSGTEDYAPASGSTRLVNTGTAVSGVSADIFGTAVPQGAAADIGAAEYAAAATDTRPPGRRASRRAAPTLPEWAHRHSRKGSRLVVLGAGGGGATPQTLSSSLSLAVQVARSATASLGLAVQAPASATASVTLAVQQALTAQASVDAALQLARTAAASVDAAVQAARSATFGADMGVQAARTATASADLAVQQDRTATTSVDAYVQAATQLAVAIDMLVQEGHSLSVAVQIAVQAAQAATSNVDLAVQLARQATASVDTAVQSARSAAAQVDLAVQAARSAGVSVDLFVQAGFAVAAAVDTAVRFSASAATAVAAAIQVARTAATDVSAVVSVQRVVTAAVAAAVQASTSAAAQVSLYVFDPAAFEFTADSRARIGAATARVAPGRIGRGVL